MEIAIIGTGKVAVRNYIPSLLRHKDVSLTCFSRTVKQAEAVGKQFGIRVARSLAEVMARQPEAVFILTQEQQRFEATRAVLAFRPKRLFFEKPLVARRGQAHVTPEDFWDGKTLLEQAQQAGTETAMVFNYRFFDQSLRGRRLVQERNFGEALNVVALSHFATWSHCIDLILSFVGPIHQISAQQSAGTHADPEGNQAPDIIASFLLGEGAAGVLLGTNALRWSAPLFELLINFEGGRLHFRDLDQAVEVIDYRSGTHEVYSPSRDESRWAKYDASFEKSVDAYLDSVRQNRPPPVPGLAGLAELQFEASMKKSIAEQRPVLPAHDFPLAPLG